VRPQQTQVWKVDCVDDSFNRVLAHYALNQLGS